MSDRQPTNDEPTQQTSEEIPPQPEPETEPGEPKPGGADAVDDATERDPGEDSPLARDQGPGDNPAIEDALPDEMWELEDTDTEATKEDGREVGPEEESPA